MDFRKGDIVWAKLKGHPYWPAKIESPPDDGKQHAKHHYCLFFGTENYAWIPHKNIAPYKEFYSTYGTKVKKASFKKAVNDVSRFCADPDTEGQNEVIRNDNCAMQLQTSIKIKEATESIKNDNCAMQLQTSIKIKESMESIKNDPRPGPSKILAGHEGTKSINFPCPGPIDIFSENEDTEGIKNYEPHCGPTFMLPKKLIPGNAQKDTSPSIKLEEVMLKLLENYTGSSSQIIPKMKATKRMKKDPHPGPSQIIPGPSRIIAGPSRIIPGEGLEIDSHPGPSYNSLGKTKKRISPEKKIKRKKSSPKLPGRLKLARNPAERSAQIQRFLRVKLLLLKKRLLAKRQMRINAIKKANEVSKKIKTSKKMEKGLGKKYNLPPNKSMKPSSSKNAITKKKSLENKASKKNEIECYECFLTESQIENIDDLDIPLGYKLLNYSKELRKKRLEAEALERQKMRESHLANCKKCSGQYHIFCKKHKVSENALQTHGSGSLQHTKEKPGQ